MHCRKYGIGTKHQLGQNGMYCLYRNVLNMEAVSKAVLAVILPFNSISLLGVALEFRLHDNNMDNGTTSSLPT